MWSLTVVYRPSARGRQGTHRRQTLYIRWTPRILPELVNAAVSDGITDIVAVHDSFGCLASQARRLHYLIRRELLLLYANQDHLGALGNRNADEFPPPPPISDLDIRELLEAENLAT